MLWVLFLGLATLVWAANDIFFKLIGNQINYFLALFVAAVSQIIIVIPFVVYAMSTGSLNHSARGYGISALIGILLGSGTIFFFYAFKYGAPLSVAMPVEGIGLILAGALAGVFLFNETLSPMVLAGMILGAISIILLTVKL